MQDRCAPLPRHFRKEHWLGILTFAETGKTFVLETMGITELNVKAIIDQICAYISGWWCCLITQLSHKSKYTMTLTYALNVLGC